MSSPSTELTLNNKLYASALTAVVFVAVSLPQVYTQTDRVFSTFEDNCPTPTGKFLHAGVFFLLNFIIMKIYNSYKQAGDVLSDGLIAKYAFYGTLLFFLLASTDTYRLTRNVYGGLSTPEGCPNVTGVIVHGIVFLAVLTLMMYFPKDKQ